MSNAPDPDLVALADGVLRRVLEGEQVNRTTLDAALAVARRIPITPPPKAGPGGAGALHLHIDIDGVATEYEDDGTVGVLDEHGRVQRLRRSDEHRARDQERK